MTNSEQTAGSNGAGPPASDNLSRRAAHAAAWTLAGSGARQFIGVGLSVALARLLKTDDFGVVAIVMSVVAVSNELRDLHLTDSLFQRREVTESDMRAAFAGTVAAGFGASALLAAAAPLLAWFYGDARLLWLGLALAAGPFIESWGGVSRALLMRGLQHKRIAAADLIALVASGGTAVVLAALKQGPWALVAFNLCGSCVTTALLIIFARWTPRPGLSRESLRSLWSFGSFLYGARILGQAGRSVDKLIVGKMGQATLGAYALGFRLMMTPVEQISWLVGRVMLPALSQMQGDPERLKRAFLRAVRLLGLVTFPVSAGLFVTAKEFTMVVYGEKWLEMVPLLRILSAAGFVGAVATSIGWVFFALGRTKTEFYWTLAQTIGLTLAALAGTPWGARGVAWGIVGATLLFSAIGFRIALRLIGLSAGEFLRALLPTATAAMFMVLLLQAGLLLVLIQMARGLQVSDTVLLAGQVVAGALIYVGCLWAAKAEAWRDGVQLLKDVLG